MSEILHDGSVTDARARPAWNHVIRPRSVLVVAVVVVALAFALTTDGFATLNNVQAVLRDASYVGIIAVAMTPMTVSGNLVSLGIAQTAVGSAMAFAYLQGAGLPVLVAGLLVVAGSLLLGVLQGAVVAVGLNPIIATLAAGSIVFGLASHLSGGGAVTLVGAEPLGWANSSVLGVPVEVGFFALVTVMVALVYGRTTLGRRTALVGSNRATARLSGISYGGVTVAAFMVFSIGVAIVGVLYSAGFGQANPQSLGTLAFGPIAALLIGGTAIQGGRGSALNSALGAVFISVINSCLTLRGLEPTQVQAVAGAVIVLAVLIMASSQRSGGSHD